MGINHLFHQVNAYLHSRSRRLGRIFGASRAVAHKTNQYFFAVF
jgi:hypothetical protein